jgi:hypothetical protein
MITVTRSCVTLDLLSSATSLSVDCPQQQTAVVQARGCLPSASLAQEVTAAHHPMTSSHMAVLSTTCVGSLQLSEGALAYQVMSRVRCCQAGHPSRRSRSCKCKPRCVSRPVNAPIGPRCTLPLLSGPSKARCVLLPRSVGGRKPPLARQ